MRDWPGGSLGARATAVRRLRTRFVVALAFGAALALLGASAATASADQLQVSVLKATPEQGVPVTLAFSGAASVSDNYGDGPNLLAVVRPSGGIGCQPSYESDQAAAGSANTDLFGESNQLTPGSFSQQTTFDPPNVSGYLVCAWLEGPNGVTTANSATFSTRGPQVGQLSVSLGNQPRPGIAYQINYTTQTDQQLTLYSVVKRAGGLPCASSYELEQQQNQTENDIFYGSGTNVFGGPTTTSGTDTEQDAGSYTICSWIEGPNAGEVDAATTTPINMGTTPPSSTHPPARLTSATELSAFLHWIASRYANARGYWTCPNAQISAGIGVCYAEIKVGPRVHFLHAAAKLQPGRVVLFAKFDTSWKRHWSRFTRRVIASTGTPGRASVNSPAYDWAWLAAGAHYRWHQHRKVFSASAFDGGSRGLGRFFSFRCHLHGRTITCTNALGDSMRYRPRG